MAISMFIVWWFVWGLPAFAAGARAGLGPDCTGNHDCTCSAGSYASTYNTYGKPSGCEPCPAGTFGAKATAAPMAAACKPCAAGTFATSASSTSCKPCPLNTASQGGQTSCIATGDCPSCTAFGWFWCMTEQKCTSDPYADCKPYDARTIAGPGASGQCADECTVCVGASKYWCLSTRQCVANPMTQCTNFNAKKTVGAGFVKTCPAAAHPTVPPMTDLKYKTPIKGDVNTHSYDYYKVSILESVGVRVSVTCSSAACYPKVVVGADTFVTAESSDYVFFNPGPCTTANPCDVHFDLFGLQQMFEDKDHPHDIYAVTQDYVVIGVYGIASSEYTIEVKSSATQVSLPDGATVLKIPAPPFTTRGLLDPVHKYYDTLQMFEIDLTQARQQNQILTITLLANSDVCRQDSLRGFYGWPENYQHRPCDPISYCNGGLHDPEEYQLGWTQDCEWNSILHKNEYCTDWYNKCASTRGTYEKSTGRWTTEWVHDTLFVEVSTRQCDQEASINPDPSSPPPYYLMIRAFESTGGDCAGCVDDSWCPHPGMTCVNGGACEWACSPACPLGTSCDGGTGKCVVE